MATDWSKQTEEMVKNWADLQQKMMQSMLGMMGAGNVGSTMPSDMWDKSINTWHDSMKSALEAQVTWAQFMSDNVTAGASSNKQLTDMSQQVVGMTRQWTDAQSKVLDTLFEEVKKYDPADMSKKMNPEDMMKSIQSWQEATRKMMEAQMEMIRTMTSTSSK